MKSPSILLSFLALAFSTPALTAQIIFNDDMESYPTATATSINDLPDNATSNPQFWSWNTFQGGGTPVTVTAGITGATGSRAAILSADFTGATDYWGAQLYSAANPGSGTASSYADLAYSFTIQTNTGQGFHLEFTSFDSSFTPTGTYWKVFTPSAAGVYQTFSGNLGEGGWAANPNGFSPNDLVLNAANYQWTIEYNGEAGWTGSGNTLLVDQATFAVVPEPNVVGLLLVVGLFALVRRRFSPEA